MGGAVAPPFFLKKFFICTFYTCFAVDIAKVLLYNNSVKSSIHISEISKVDLR
jgi:hypothetical protein